MAYFFNPAGKSTTALTSLKLDVDQAFVIGLMGTGPKGEKLYVRWAGDTGKAEQLKTTGPGQRYRITPRAPGKQQLLAMYDGMLEELLNVEVTVPKKAEEDMAFLGNKLVWFHNLPAGMTGPVEFSATSGLEGSQISGSQQIKDAGPIPEGRYTFLARRDPKRVSTVVENYPECKLDVREGIQILPHGTGGCSFPGWGSHRVRLTPLAGNAAPHRGGFYLHDSHKGYSHGCIEVAAFFDALIQYADEGKGPKILTIRVSYATGDLSTLGATKKEIKADEYQTPAAD